MAQIERTELEIFAEDVRGQAHKIMVAALVAGNEQISTLAGSLCTHAARVAQQKRMAQEVAAPDRYALAALAGLPMNAPEETEED